MKTPYQLKFHEGEEICEDPDNYQTVVMYSESAGFFLKSFISQWNRGAGWETYDPEDQNRFVTVEATVGEKLLSPSNLRQLTTYRPISRDQAIRMLLAPMTDHGGMMTTISNALDAAGVEALQETTSSNDE